MLNTSFIIKNILIIVASCVLSATSYLAGYYQQLASQVCDPFQIIKDQPHSPYPNINTLLKK